MRSTPTPPEIFLVQAPVLARDADALERLDALLLTLAHEVEHLHGVAGSEVEGVLTELALLDLLDEIGHLDDSSHGDPRRSGTDG